MVLSHAAEYFRLIKDPETAGKLFVGSLLLDPNFDIALLGYAHHFIDTVKGLLTEGNIVSIYIARII